MDSKDLELLLDSCFVAKKITEVLPALPAGMRPRHIHVLHAVYELQKSAEGCRVSDVGKRLGITMPSVTKLVQELHDKKLLTKCCESSDKRITLLSLTDAGADYVERYVIEFHREWSAAMGDISSAQAVQVTQILARLRDTMPGTVREKDETE